MPVITPYEIDRIIVSINPSANIKVSDHGMAPGLPNVQRFSVETHIFGADAMIKCGENVVLLVNGAPREVLRHLPLLDADTVKKKIRAWLMNFEKYLEQKELPLIKTLAEHAFGKELKIEKTPNAIRVYYNLFIVVVTADSAGILLSSNRRIVLFRKFSNNKELQQFFDVGRYTAEAIMEGTIK